MPYGQARKWVTMEVPGVAHFRLSDKENPMSASIFSVCREAFRRNRFPALVLQSAAGIILLLYFLVPATRPAFEGIGALRNRHGYLFSAISTMIFGGLVSWVVLWNRGRIPKGQVWAQFVFFLVFWAVQGLMVDTLYRLQGAWFGQDNDPVTLFKKVLLDQGPYNILYATPVSLCFYAWKDAGFSVSRARESLRGRFAHRYWTIMVSAWIVWIPAVTMIYSLPAELQIPLFNLVVCFFTLVLAFVSRVETEEGMTSDE